MEKILKKINSFDNLEPSIRKAKFIVSKERIYTLEFDNNIQMQELKIMIQRIPKKIPQKKWIKRIKLIKKKF